MTKLGKEQQQLLDQLRSEYQHIYALEEELNLRVGQKDSRIRIDYFYDAPRALTGDSLPLDYRRLRLSLDWLAYDATAIRYLEHNPLAQLKPSDQHFAASTELIVVDPNVPDKANKPNRAQKNALKHHYLRFGVLFVALFKPFADRDYRDKQEEMEEQLSMLAQVENMLEQLATGAISVEQVTALLPMIDDPKLKAKLEALLADERYHDPQAMKEAMSLSAGAVDGKEVGLKQNEKTHMEFLTAQLAMYEQSKDFVKQLAGQGLNIVGQHMDQAMSQSTDRGRGM